MKFLKLCLLSLFVLVAVPAAANAQEITPDPSSYRYGSTSEFSASSTLTVSSSTDDDETLADTGGDTTVVLALGLVLIVGAGLVVKRKLLA